ncbi:MAG: tetratricopeptide repeat protein [Chloroflexi bacterium]|nr:tetratricopeptide repeat protein [Chloroflexota bacterium]
MKKPVIFLLCFLFITVFSFTACSKNNKAVNIPRGEAKGMFNAGSQFMRRDTRDVYLRRAQSFFSERKYKEAEEAANKALELDPQSGIAYGILGNICFDNYRFKEAEKAYRKAIEYSPDELAPYSSLALTMLEFKRYDEAGDIILHCLEKHPDNDEAYATLASIYYEQRKLALAQEAAGKALKLNSRAAGAHIILAEICGDRYKYDEAIRHYLAARQSDPEFEMEMHAGLGTVLLKKKDFDSSEAAFKKALELYPQYYCAWTQLGDLYTKKRKYDDARAVLEKAMKIDPDYEDAYYYMGNLAAAKGDIDSAESYYKKALKINPDNFEDIYTGLSTVSLLKRKPDEAQGWIKKALDMNPESANALVVRGMIYNKLGNKVGAQTDFERAAWLDQASDDARRELAYLLIEKGELEKAGELAKSTVKLNPYSPKNYLVLSRWAAKCGFKDQAKEALNKAKKLDPGIKAD